MTEQESSSSSSVIEVENWTKWRLYVKSDNESSNYPSVSEGTSSDSLSPKVIYAGARDQISLASKVLYYIYMNSEVLNEYFDLYYPKIILHVSKSFQMHMNITTLTSIESSPVSKAIKDYLSICVLLKKIVQ